MVRVKRRSLWQIVKHRPWVPVAVLAGIVLIVVLILYRLNWDWTGLDSYTPPTQASNFQRGKTLWDWLQLLVIPIMLAIGGFWLNQVQKSREENATGERTRIEQEAAEKRAKTEREIAEDNQREVVLQNYIDKMSELLLDRKLRESKKEDEVRKIARVRTLTVLPRLDKGRKTSVLLFLYESDLIKGANRIIDLDGADLSKKINLFGVDLREANLGGANLKEVFLLNADLRDANLSGADLRRANLRADLRGANLSDANLSEVDLKGAYLINANLSDAKLSKATLYGANLHGANLSNAHLSYTNLTKTTAILKGINLKHADLSDANLSHAILKKTNLSQANLSNSDLSGADLSDADLSGADLSGADLSDAIVTTEQLEKAKSRKGTIMPKSIQMSSAFEKKAEVESHRDNVFGTRPDGLDTP